MPTSGTHMKRRTSLLAKGQGNYETLCDEQKNIYFLFKVKCPVVSGHSGFAAGAHVLAWSGLSAEIPVRAEWYILKIQVLPVGRSRVIYTPPHI